MKFNPKDTIEKLKAILNFSTDPAAADTQVATELKDYTTSTGAILKIDKLEAGGKAFSDAGTTPAPEGTYTLTDGTALVIGALGAITTVTLPAAQVDTPPTQEAMQAMFAKFAAGTPEDRLANLESMCKALMTYNFQWKITEATREAIEAQAIAAFNALGTPTAMSAQFTAQEKKIAELEKGHAADLLKFNTALTGALDLLQQFAETPSADPIQVPTDKEVKAQNKQDRIALLAENIKAVKEGKK